MKSLQQHIQEALKISKSYKDATIRPKDSNELGEIINDRMNKTINDGKLILSDVDVSNIKDMQQLFGWLDHVRYLDISEWNVSNVDDMSMMFYDSKIEEINMSNWNIDKEFSVSQIFDKCNKLRRVDLYNWNECEAAVEIIYNLIRYKNKINFILPDWFDEYK